MSHPYPTLGEYKAMADIYNFGKKNDEQTLIKTDIKKRKKEQFVETLREGDVVNDFFAVKIKSPPRSYKRGTWFSLTVSDKTGDIGVKYWGGENKDRVRRLYDSFKVGDVIQVRLGNVEIYDDQPQISINETAGGLRRCGPDEYILSEYTPSLEDTQIETYYQQIQDEIAHIDNKELQALLNLFFKDPDFIKEYTHAPSAMVYHHNYVGGNLEHTVGVIRLCHTICEQYPTIDKDLVITGAILHDIGKLKEYSTTAAIDRTGEGNFIGHIVIGDRWVREKIAELRTNGTPFDADLETYLSHLILSHHGKYEYGSPRMPKLVEACVLHHADNMDAQVKNYIQNLEEIKKTTDEDWAFVWDADIGRKRPIFTGDK
jgi:3'-5' exoribonuclease